MTDEEIIRMYAQRVAQNCIEDWAREGWHELNDVFDTDFGEDVLLQIADLAATARAVLPEDE